MNSIFSVEMDGISKSFGGIAANDNVDLKLLEGECHALLGENGAGKSTLMNMLSGIYRPDSGSIKVYGEIVEFTSPKKSISKGIGMIHQHFKLVNVFDGVENIIVGQKHSFLLNKSVLREKIKCLCSKYDLQLDVDKKVYDMSIGEKQTLEIVKALYSGAKILIMDEPTAVLTPQETRRLFAIIENMKSLGCTIVIITHKMDEVMEISDRVTVLRKGKAIGTFVTKETNSDILIESMVGKKVDLHIEKTVWTGSCETLLELEGIKVENKYGNTVLSDINLDVKNGEILGVCGLTGSGQRELCEVICGLIRPSKGTIIYQGNNILECSPLEIIKMGIRLGFVPEDRLGMGLVANMDIVDNTMLKDYKDTKGIFISRKESEKIAKEIVEELEILTPSVREKVKNLSGGNIQKVLLGRELHYKPRLLITSYPVRGLDIGASYKIYELLNKQREKGDSVIFVGEDLDVLMELCDRICVLCEGKITGIVRADSVTKEELGELMSRCDRDEER